MPEAGTVWRRGLLTAGAFALVACAGTGQRSQSNFQADYSRARLALEDGEYGTAIRRFDAMIADAGPLETRLRLEKAHALLRSDDYPAAAREASVVASAHDDNRRAAALAVLGTAEHQMARNAMSSGDFGPATAAHLRRAQAALKEMLVSAPDLDPTGAMAERSMMVEASLARVAG